VADTGQGIARDFQAYVFERFRQAEGGSTRAHGGLGLGLSIVRQLVELHGGTVGVYSEGEGRGASFTVSLPLTETRRRALTPDPSSMGARAGLVVLLEGVGVLLVDDDDDTREMLRTLLDGCGAAVRAASSVAEALRLFHEARPTVLVSDVGMPGEDGLVLIERIRALPASAGGNVPAVAVTAYARTEDRTRALLAGFNNHLPKPVEPMELLAVVASLAGRTGKRGS
jgi:CheY-like chemotaxis protein